MSVATVSTNENLPFVRAEFDTLVGGLDYAAKGETGCNFFSGRGELQTALVTAMGEGGPQQAITVCKDIAPQIASLLSRESGAAVSRTSLRLRNPQNLPREWQEEVLRDFDAAAASDGNAAVLEYFSAADSNNGARYMKAIPTGGLCLACHGSEIAPGVHKLLQSQYPHDRATGYASGEIRGAFSVIWPRAEKASPGT